MVRSERILHLTASPEALWDLLADTDRLNRELGLPPVQFIVEARAEGGSFLKASARNHGFWFHYDEEPYCWIRPGQWSVRRFLDGTPLKSLRPLVTLTANAIGGTTVSVVMEIEPRNVAAVPLAQTIANISVGAWTRVLCQFEAYLKKEIHSPYPRHSGASEAVRARIHHHICSLQETSDPVICERLGRFLAESPVEDVVNFRPYALAAHWNLPRLPVLLLCLQAVKVGLLDLRWRILCPSCRAPGDTVPHLGELAAGKAHCPSCNIHFGPEFDRHVEVCFSIAPAIRETREGEAIYCIGGPMRSPHTLMQWYLMPGETTELTVSVPPGSYALTSPQSINSVPLLVVPDEPQSNRVLVRAAGDRVQIEPPETLAERGRWRLENQSALPVLLRCEHPGWVTEAVTAAEVTSLQAFRDSFSSQVLSPDAEVTVRQIGILFTDLKGSTALYRQQGDAPSYAMIRDHFSFLREVIGAHQGGVIKTMGDAIMAAFAVPANAVSAAVAIQRLAPERCPGLVMKIGVHAGPALAINANGTLDYFGQVVNRAARVQGQSIGGDVVVCESLLRDPLIQSRIVGVPAELFTAELRGDVDSIRLIRLRPDREIRPKTV